MRVRAVSVVLLLIAIPACDWVFQKGPPAQQKFEREEIYAANAAAGEYRCTKCGALLFRSEKKLAVPGSRWPVFQESEPGALVSEGNQVVCAHCHLQIGHRCRNGVLVGNKLDTSAPICATSSSLRFQKK